MNDSELQALLGNMESDRVERKASTSDRDKICQAICAFANDLPGHGEPGVIFVGVNDNGSCANLRVTDEVLRVLAGWRGDGNILPFPTMVVQKRTLADCELAVVIVQPSDDPPVRYKGQVWIRVGPRRATASAEKERRLTEKRRARMVPFDVRPVEAASIADLDIECFRRTYLPSALTPELVAQNQRSVEDQLASLRFTTPGPIYTPTVVGILTVGQEPRSFLPGAYVQFLRIEGEELTDPIKDQREVTGPLPQLLRNLDEALMAHITVATDIASGPTERREPDYPIVALQQLARNAVLHRNYEGTNAPSRVYWFSNRIEIHSPGGPYGQVSRGNFGSPGITDYRNPHLAEAMRNLGYVQRFGIGIQMARSELARNGNPAPEFAVEDTHVLVIVRRKP